MAGYKARYLEWTQNDLEAAKLIELFGELQHIADDFVDDDVAKNMGIRSGLMTQLLDICLLRIPSNQFYAANIRWLAPIVASVLVQINCADEWYDNPNEEKRLYSFVWRTAAEQLIYQIAYLIGGLKHAQRVAQEYRNVWLATDEDHSYTLWKKEHA